MTKLRGSTHRIRFQSCFHTSTSPKRQGAPISTPTHIAAVLGKSRDRISLEPNEPGPKTVRSDLDLTRRCSTPSPTATPTPQSPVIRHGAKSHSCSPSSVSCPSQGPTGIRPPLRDYTAACLHASEIAGPGLSLLQLLCALAFRQPTVECAKRKVPGFPGKLQDQAVGKHSDGVERKRSSAAVTTSGSWTVRSL
jgi:hypothetical protein